MSSAIAPTIPMPLDDALRQAFEYRTNGRLIEARDLYEQILAQRPGHIPTLTGLADTFVLLRLTAEAIAVYEHALTLEPDSLQLLHNLAVAHHNSGDRQKAIVFVQRCLEIDPNFAQGHCTLGSLFSEEEEGEMAVEHFRKALELQPNYPEALDNLGVALLKMGRIDQAVECFQRAADLKPDFAATRQNLGMVLLLKGDFERGLKEYEWRWRVPDKPRSTRYPPFMQWDGSDLNGKTILLYNEQGLGDTIQFVRYIPQVLARGGKVILECQRPLKPLLESFPGPERVVAVALDELPPFDVHCALMSLPFVLGTRKETIPNKVPYIYADPKKEAFWRVELARARGFKVGIAWAGRPIHKGDKARSIRLEQLAPLAAASGAIFFTLQKGPASDQVRHPPADMRVIDCSRALNDFTDTAALIANLDLVITVDTSVAHLAGAMGKPVWTLIPFAPDWRWMLDRTDTPWYPTMRLLRQTTPGDWKSVIEKAANELASFTRRMAPGF